MVKVIVGTLWHNPSNPKSTDPLRDPMTAAMFPRCTAMDTHWRRNWYDLCSPVDSLRWCPRSRNNWKASGPNTPDVSTATGTKWWLASNWAYLALLAHSACCATVPEDIAALGICKGANVSGHVASQTKTFPCFQGTNEMPSGCFPSER